MALDESRVEAAIQKIEQLDEFIAQALDQDDQSAFRGKWGEKIAEVEPYKKGLFGDDWDEGNELYNMAKSQREAGATDEEIDGTMEKYFLDTVEKFKHLAEIASTPSEAAAAEEVAETAQQAADEVAADDEGGEAPSGEVEVVVEGEPEGAGEPEEEDMSWMDEEDPHDAMIANHVMG